MFSRRYFVVVFILPTILGFIFEDESLEYETSSVDPPDIPEGAASLAFVFDVTGSMHNDLVQVIEGAREILQTTLARNEQPLYNYVLVPFKDPRK